MSGKLSLEDMRLEKVILDRLMKKQRIIIQSANDRLANLRREKKRVMEQIFNLGDTSGHGILAGNKQQ